MIRTLSVLALVAGIAASMPAAGAEVTFFERDGFAGRSFTANQSISNFANVGFNDRASSVVVRQGNWQLCSEAYFRGRCVTLGRGEYPTLRSMGLDNQVSSARDVEWISDRGGPPPYRGARVELFESARFSGNAYAVNGMVTNLNDVGFNDRARSLIVHEGRWEACEHADFRGVCETFGPGRYPDLGPFGGRMSSIRPARL